MLAQLKAELRKLLSVRSTYILTIIALVLIGLFSWFGTSRSMYFEDKCDVTGEVVFSSNPDNQQLAMPTEDPCPGGNIISSQRIDNRLPKEKLLLNMQQAVPLMVTFTAIILVLLVAHEYRYNTINYTLTISRSRTRVLVAKLLVGSGFIVLTTLLAIGATLAITQLAIALKDLVLPAQDYDWLYVTARHVGYSLGFATFFMAIAMLVRNLTASIAAVFVLPILMGISSVLLTIRKIEPTKVLPFPALDRFGNVLADMTNASVSFDGMPDPATKPATMLGALLVFSVYLIGIWIITWLTFLRRDAN